MAIDLTFVCGHTAKALTGNETTPSCPECGERVISRVNAPPPVFSGHARGPHAQYKDLPAKAVKLGDSK